MIPITLSVVIPAYNEAAFIGTLLERIQAVELAGIGVTPELNALATVILVVVAAALFGALALQRRVVAPRAARE